MNTGARITDVSIELLLSTPVGMKLGSALSMLDRLQEYAEAAAYKADAEANSKKAATIATFAILKKMQGGTSPSGFTQDDWKEVLAAIGDYVLLMPDSEYSVFVFEMYENCIRKSLQSLVGHASPEECEAIEALADELRTQEEAFHSGEISEPAYIEECLWISLEAMFKLLSASILPHIKDDSMREFSGALADFAFEYGRLMLYRKEQALLEEYIEAQYELDRELEVKLALYLENLERENARFIELLDHAFEPDYRDSFLRSAMLARLAGVEESEILNTAEDVDDFFLN